MKNAILGALFNDFVPKMIVGTHILRGFRSHLMKNVYLCSVTAMLCCLQGSTVSRTLHNVKASSMLCQLAVLNVRNSFLFTNIILMTFAGCVRSDYSYYCEESDFSFKIQSINESVDVITFYSGDSIFFQHPYNGDFLGVCFYVLPDSNIIYLSHDFNYYRYVEKKYRFCQIHYDSNTYKSEKTYLDHEYWYYAGGCDQGRYTFSVWHDSIYVKVIEPLEWK